MYTSEEKLHTPSIVAMFGLIIPEPFAIPPTLIGIPPTLYHPEKQIANYQHIYQTETKSIKSWNYFIARQNLITEALKTSNLCFNSYTLAYKVSCSNGNSCRVGPAKTEK